MDHIPASHGSRSGRESGEVVETEPLVGADDRATEQVDRATEQVDPLVTRSHLLSLGVAKNLGLILLWYFFSTVLSLWNKLLVGKEHGLFGKGAFPAPFFMSSVQFFLQHLIARGLMAAGLVSRVASQRMEWKTYMKTVLPNGVATGLDIGFSNYSLVFITLSFYVMCKSTTPLFLLTFAIIWGVERPSWALAGVVFVITCGLLLLVAGETKFDALGFILVMSASALAGLRWTITQVLLQGNRHHTASGGPVEVIYQLTPIMGSVLALVSIAFEKLWNVLPNSPYFSSWRHGIVTMGILSIGGVIAFAMVWAEFMLISNTSALTFMVAGTFKEIVTVGAAVLFLHERFTPINGIGLLVLIAGVVMFNYIKYQKLKQVQVITVVHEESSRMEAPYVGSDSGNSQWGKRTVEMNDPVRMGGDIHRDVDLEMEMDMNMEMVINPSSPPTPTGAVAEERSKRSRLNSQHVAVIDDR